MRTSKILAMTLIEIIIAISVFAVGVLAVLQLVVNNIQTVDHVSKHMDATMLASQWLELMYELRNSNSYKEARWDCLETDLRTEDGCTKEKNLHRYAEHNDKALSIAPAGPESNMYRSLNYIDIGSQSTSMKKWHSIRLYRHVSGEETITYFNHDPVDGDETPYSRYITISTIPGYDNPAVAFQVTSHVLIDDGSRDPKEVSLSSIIGKIID